jgi:hypothetical protein
LQFPRILDDFISAGMFAKINTSERYGAITKWSLFWRKAINQFAYAPYPGPAIFDLENIAWVRLVFHGRFLSGWRFRKTWNVFALMVIFTRSGLTSASLNISDCLCQFGGVFFRNEMP